MDSSVAVTNGKTAFLVRAASTDRFRLSERAYPPHSQFPVHVHRNSYIIIPITVGYRSTFGKNTRHFKPWSVTFLSAGVEHTSTYPGKKARILYVEIPAELLGQSGSPLGTNPINVLAHNSHAEHMARQLYREFTSPDEYSKLGVESVLLNMLACFGRDHKQSPVRAPKWLSVAEAIIDARFSEPLHLSDIAQEIGVHPGHLARAFRQHFQCTVGERIRRKRLRFAFQELSNPDSSLASIAQAAGYTDQSHLTTAFKASLGITPAAYRRSKKMLLPYQNVTALQAISAEQF